MSGIAGIAALVYLAAHGARMPLLALRGLLRVRNLIVVAAPALALGAFVLALEGRADERVASGAIAVAVVPAPLIATGVVTRLRGRMDLAGALVLGTVIVSLLVVGSRGALAAGALFVALEVFAIAAMVAGALPPLRDALLPVLRIVGWLAFALVLLAAALGMPLLVADGQLMAQSLAVAVALFAVGVAVAFGAALATGREPLAAIAGAGLRDPALAVALAAATAGSDATGVPLAYAAFCLGLAGLALLRR